MGTTTFLSIPVVKGDINITPDFPGGVRKLVANAVTKAFNKSFITNITDMVSPQNGSTYCYFTYEDPASSSRIIYEATITRAALIALDA